MAKLNLPKQEQQEAIATILGGYKPNPAQVVVDYKGSLRNWDISWLQQLADEERIEVVDEEGNQFKFVAGTSVASSITEEQINPI